MSVDVAEPLRAAMSGGEDEQRALFEATYSNLKAIARRQLRRTTHTTLNTTALVHEVYLRP